MVKKKITMKERLVKPFKSKNKEKDFLAVQGLDMKGYKKKIADRKFPDRTFLIRMKLINGFWDTFTTSSDNATFNYKGRQYIIDADMLEYDVGSKLWSSVYHQSLCLPIKITIPVKEVTAELLKAGQIESALSLNPKVLDAVVESDFVQKVVAGQEQTEMMTQMKSWLLYNLIGTGIIIAFLFFKFSGIVKGG